MKINIKPFIKGVLKIADSAVLGGAVHNVLEGTETHPKGKMDWAKIIGASIPIVLLILIGLGVITIEEANEFNK